MPADRVTSKSPWHVVFVLDDSGSMSGSPAKDVNEAMETMIEEMRLLSQGMKPYFKVSVIHFGSDSKIICEAMSEMSVDLSSVTSLTADGGTTNAAAALDDARRVLERRPGEVTDFVPFVFFLSDGAPDDRSLAIEASNRIKGLNIVAGTPRVVTIGFGEANDDFMKALATNEELYKKLPSPDDIKRFLPAIGTIASSASGAEAVEDAVMKL